MKTFSFDIFDTCVSRPFALPTDLFLEVGANLFKVAYDGPLNQRDFSLAFSRERIVAEKRARRLHPEKEDITLAEIYQMFISMDGLALSSSELMDSEVAAEIAHIRPFAIIKDKIDIIRAEYGRVLFISDMYLPQSVIREILDKNGLLRSGDSVYVSGEVGLCKHTGNLFRHVLSAEKISPSELFHTGDNLHSDVKAPRQLGINATHHKSAQMSTHERRIKRLAQRLLPNTVTTASHIIGVSRISRHTYESNLSAELVSLLTSVVSPLLFSFTAWTINQSIDRNKQTLYFASRNGQVFFKIAEVINRHHSRRFEAKYLHGSRNAWFLPSAMGVNKEELYWAWLPGMSTAARDILRRLGFSREETRKILSKAEWKGSLNQYLTDTELETFISTVIQHPYVSERISNKASIARKLTLDYFRQLGMLENTNWAIVDIGWVLNCQYAMEKILRIEDPTMKVSGYYFGVVDNHRYAESGEAGDFHSFITSGRSGPKGAFSCDWIFRLPTIVLIEHLLTGATHATVTGYTSTAKGIEPTLKEGGEPVAYYDLMSDIHTIIQQTTEEYCLLGLHEQPTVLHEMAELALEELQRFCQHPSEREARSVATIPTNIEQSHDSRHTRSLASPLTLRDLAAMIAHDLLPQNLAPSLSSHHAWAAGSAALGHPAVTLLFKGFFQLNRARKWMGDRISLW